MPNVGWFIECYLFFNLGKLEEVYNLLKNANPNMVVYKKEEIPDHYHYGHNVRIMPVIIEVKEGWTVMQNRNGSFMCA